MEDLKAGTSTLDRQNIARLITDWVSGTSIADLANRYFSNDHISKSFEDCTKAIYRSIANAATWGLAALQKMPTSGLDWESLSELERKRMSNLPSMIHYGVNTDEAVLMRKNNVPRSIASRLGELYSASVGDQIFSQGSAAINTWINNLDERQWSNVAPNNGSMSGQDYRRIWQKLSGN
jgi:hypothetical protein